VTGKSGSAAILRGKSAIGGRLLNSIAAMIPTPAEHDWTPLEKTYTHRIHTLMKLSDRVTQRGYEEESGVPAHEGRCLAAVGSYAPLSINDLARNANLDKGQASRAAQALVDKGLIRKTTNPSDGRGVELSLTPLGQPVWERTMRLVTRRNQEVTACLTAAQQKQLDTLLDILVSHARAQAAQHCGSSTRL
jgi:DNA-binding MarR family transcriptional regulator